MKTIFNNPFRILGLPVTAGDEEITAFSKDYNDDIAFPFFPPVDRNPANIAAAQRQIDNINSKFMYSLFWFWNNNVTDNAAFELIGHDKIHDAIAVWEKAITKNQVTTYYPGVKTKDLIHNSADWPQTNNEEHTFNNTSSSEYVIERKKDDSYSIPTIYTEINKESNWSIECDSSWKNGTDNGSYGIVFGREMGSFYFFGISGGGSYMFGRFDDWNFTPYIDWTETPNFYYHGRNHLKIEKINEELHFFINGTYVNSYQNEPFFGNYFGFKVSSRQTVGFSNFKFCDLAENNNYGEGLKLNPENYNNVKNLFLLFLSLYEKDPQLHQEYLFKGIKLAGLYFSSPLLTGYLDAAAGDGYEYNPAQVLGFFIDHVLNIMGDTLDQPGGIQRSQLLVAFSAFPKQGHEFIYNRFVIKQLQNISNEIEIAGNTRKAAPEEGCATGQNLKAKTAADLAYLSNTLGGFDVTYQLIADKVSNEIIQGGIDYFNKTTNDEAYLSLYEYALSIAVSDAAKEKAKTNIDSCQQFIQNKHLYTCYFCGKNAQKAEAKHPLKIYKVNSRSYFPRSVQYNYLDIDVPRCNECKEIHAKKSNVFSIVLVSAIVAGIIIGQVAGGFWFLGAILGLGAGYFGGKQYTDSNQPEVKALSNKNLKEYPEINKLVKQGWQLIKPRA